MNYRKLIFTASLLSAGVGIVYVGLSLFQTGMAFAETGLGNTGIAAPVSVQLIGIIALLICIAIVGFVIWFIVKNKKSSSNLPYKGIESNTLDSNPEMCEKFYTMAYNFRAEHGHKKFQQTIIKNYKFFYDFHNRALQLIDDLFTQTPAFAPSREFIIATIKSGHIGDIFTDINYEGGIDGQSIAPHVACIAYANTDSIDIWTSDASHPVCVLNKKQMELNRPNKENGYVTAVLVAELKGSHKTVKVKLGFPDFKYDPHKDKIERHEIMATQNYHKLEDWLKKHAPKQPAVELSNFGISVEHDDGYDIEYGIPAPELADSQSFQPNFLSQALQMLKRDKIDAYFTRYDMPIVKSKSVMDALVMCSGLGLVVISEQHTTGSVSYNGDAGWLVTENDRSQIIENVCIQAEKAKNSLQKLLKMREIDWPITSLVVFSASDLELNLKPGSTRLQCDVIRLREINQWFATNSMTHKVRFTKDDYNRLALLLGKKQRQYVTDIQEA